MLAALRRFKRLPKSRTNPDQIRSDFPEGSELPPPVNDGLLGQIPPKSECLLFMKLEKADCGRRWHQRRAFLSHNSLVLARMDSDYVREEIEIDLIEEIFIEDEDANPRQVNLSFRDDVVGEENVDSARSTVPKLKSKKSATQKLKSKSIVAAKSNLGEDAAETCCVFQIVERVEELNSKVRYSLRAATRQDAKSMIRAIKEAKDRKMNSIQATILRTQKRLQAFRSKYEQLGIMAFCLTLNFVLDVAQAEMQPTDGSPASIAFLRFDAVFTIIFTLDLALNFLSSHPLAFIRAGWNLLDLLIVTISIAELVDESQSGTVNSVRSIRIVRAFRAIRLLTGIGKLREIIDALLASVRRTATTHMHCKPRHVMYVCMYMCVCVCVCVCVCACVCVCVYSCARHSSHR
jgi:hypothetical protein